ncbi:hypothetical protein GCM10027446_32310 [Angustibacter peucedani]
MTTVIVGMLIAVLIAAVVVALVAVPARREGRDILTPQGEQLVQAARERTVDAVGAARDKVGDLADRLPARSGDQPGPGGTTSTQAPSSDIDLRPQTTDVGQHRA